MRELGSKFWRPFFTEAAFVLSAGLAVIGWRVFREGKDFKPVYLFLLVIMIVVVGTRAGFAGRFPGIVSLYNFVIPAFLVGLLLRMGLALPLTTLAFVVWLVWKGIPGARAELRAEQATISYGES